MTSDNVKARLNRIAGFYGNLMGADWDDKREVIDLCNAAQRQLDRDVKRGRVSDADEVRLCGAIAYVLRNIVEESK